jgi:hypothetical protein
VGQQPRSRGDAKGSATRHPQRKVQDHRLPQITSASTTSVVSSTFIMAKRKKSAQCNFEMVTMRKGGPPASTKAQLECAAYKAQLECLIPAPYTKEIQSERKHIQDQIKNYCGGS